MVEAEDWSVLARVDGRRTLEEIFAAMGASPLAGGNRLECVFMAFQSKHAVLTGSNLPPQGSFLVDEANGVDTNSTRTCSCTPTSTPAPTGTPRWRGRPTRRSPM